MNEPAEKIVKPIQATPQTQNLETAVTPPVDASPPPRVKPIEPGKSVTIPDAPQTDSPGPSVDTLIPTDPYQIDPLFYEVANYFGLEHEDHATAKNKLSEIVDYIIGEKKSNAPEDVLTALRELEDTVQPPAWGERRYTNVYRYVRLLNKSRSLEQSMEALKKNGNQKT